MILSLAACNGAEEQAPGDSSSEANGYDAFAQAMTDMRDAGTEYVNKGLDFQAQSMYAFSGASLSSMRYAVEYILWLKGEGESIEEVCEGSRYIGWNEIAAICYASPYPYYFEGLLYQIQGENENAKPCYVAALMNPAYPEEGVDFYYLKNMEVADLYTLREELRELEKSVYELYTPRLVQIERDEYCFYPEYLRAKSAELLESEDNAGAFAFAQAALLNDSFDELNYRNAVLCAIAAEDLWAAAEYLDAGLLLFPEDEGLKQLYTLFEELGGAD